MNTNLKMGEDFVMFPHPVITLAENMSKEEKGEFYQAVVDFLFGNDVRLESPVVIFAFSFIKDMFVSVTNTQKKVEQKSDKEIEKILSEHLKELKNKKD